MIKVRLYCTRIKPDDLGYDELITTNHTQSIYRYGQLIEIVRDEEELYKIMKTAVLFNLGSLELTAFEKRFQPKDLSPLFKDETKVELHLDGEMVQVGAMIEKD